MSPEPQPEKFETDWQPVDDAVARSATLNPEKEVDRDRTESAD